MSSAINESGIAYNDGIIIDSNFCTKDKVIYAAGPVTRYCSKYYADSKSHEYYDSYEIGSKVIFLIYGSCENEKFK